MTDTLRKSRTTHLEETPVDNDGGRDFVTLLPLRLYPDPGRTVVRPFVPADPDDFADPERPRATRIVERVLALDEENFSAELKAAWDSLDQRHRDVKLRLLQRFDQIANYVPDAANVCVERRLLIAAYLSAEYSYEAAALFNPSIVPHPEQGEGDDTRFILSLRGIGEGHMSSVTFRTGIWRESGEVELDTPSPVSVAPIVGEPQGWNDDETIQLDCHGSRDPSETVLFPIVESQSRGIEDLRLTPFSFPHAPQSYLGTFTALGDKGVRQEMLKTEDFRSFKMHPVRGELAGAKGLAIFPRKVGDDYLAISRHDGENLWLATSDDLFSWKARSKLMGPEYPWEIIQIGNCGSPIEIDEGWLVLTHGVGVVRNYVMGAALLDRDDPSRVIARLAEPLLEPGKDDRDGYVPNVVYSCGALVRGRTMLLPYAVADEFTRFCLVDLDGLVGAMAPVA